MGAATIAAYGVGWYESFNEAAAAMSGKTKLIKPDPKTRQTWDELLEIYGRLFPDNEETFNALVKFAVKSSKGLGK